MSISLFGGRARDLEDITLPVFLSDSYESFFPASSEV